MPRRANALTADCVQVEDSAFPHSLLNDMDEAATTTPSRATATETRRSARRVDERSNDSTIALDMVEKSLSKGMSSYTKGEDSRLLLDRAAEHMLLVVDAETWKLMESTMKIVAESRSAQSKAVRALNALYDRLEAKQHSQKK